MNFRTSLSDDVTATSSTPIAGQSAVRAIGGASGPTEQSQRPETSIEPMDGNVFQPIHGKKNCCGKGSGQNQIVNVNVNTGSAPGLTPNSTEQVTEAERDSLVQSEIQRAVQQEMERQKPLVATPFEGTAKIVERKVYTPLTMVREQVKKIKQYLPMNRIVDRKAGRTYEDRQMVFEGTIKK